MLPALPLSRHAHAHRLQAWRLIQRVHASRQPPQTSTPHTAPATIACRYRGSTGNANMQSTEWLLSTVKHATPPSKHHTAENGTACTASWTSSEPPIPEPAPNKPEYNEPRKSVVFVSVSALKMCTHHHIAIVCQAAQRQPYTLPACPNQPPHTPALAPLQQDRRKAATAAACRFVPSSAAHTPTLFSAHQMADQRPTSNPNNHADSLQEASLMLMRWRAATATATLQLCAAGTTRSSRTTRAGAEATPACSASAVAEELLLPQALAACAL
jgi:hypothetical protein